ncbi:unnamed protein product [Phyllotreta striolata]|uniref:Uncharacterized protein n=1 Tax=Phyllotreta striolata TaxID=444603 RepID=A0A9N9TGH1_PHYSR|nr:unnamed protein product [Phyllotreta striolata]
MIENSRNKLKVIRYGGPKLPYKRIKCERDKTPQRWSRRIQSLPPIPIEVIATKRKNKTVKPATTRGTPNAKFSLLKKLCLKSLRRGYSHFTQDNCSPFYNKQLLD